MHVNGVLIVMAMKTVIELIVHLEDEVIDSILFDFSWFLMVRTT